MRDSLYISVVSVIVLLSGCVITQPDLHITGEKTLIERQITGEYMELEDDAWIISSVNTDSDKGEAVLVESGNEDMLAAMKIREYHSDKIRKYKDEEAIGEKNDGLITYRTTGKYEKDSAQKNILLSVIDEENNARETIFVISLQKSGVAEPDETAILEFGKSFAEEQYRLAAKNDWLQDENGKWARKK